MQIDSTVVERAAALWKHNSLSLGIRGIDAQHAWLVALVLELEWSLGQAPEAVPVRFGEIVDEARSFAALHFQAEERLFSELRYSDVEKHIRTHHSFLQAVENVSTRSVDNREEAERLHQLLRAWLIQHILGEDRGYAEYFRKRKLLEEANRLFDSMNKDGALVSKPRFDFLNLISASNHDIEVTSPTMLREIGSIWNRLNLRIGVPIIDVQHLWLIKMLVDMDTAMNQSQMTREAVLTETIEEASRYIDVHFRTEEQLMEVIGFENRASHMARHHNFEGFVQARRKDMETGNARMAMTIVNDLREWLVNHIALEDKQFVAFYKTHQAQALEFSKEQIRSGTAGIRQNQLLLYKAIVGT